MSRAQYHYGHLRDRRPLHVALGRLKFVGENLVMFEFLTAWLGLTAPACVLRPMTHDEFDQSCLKIFHHQAIYRRFNRRTGKGLMMLAPKSKSAEEEAGAVA